MTPAEEADRWAHLARAETDASELAPGALLIAAHEYPGLDVHAVLRELQDMADTLHRRLRPDISACDTLIALNHYFYEELGFRGNAADYYDARNSYLNDVLERRLGIPISLAVLYIDLGRRLGLELDGVSFPSHFLVRCALRSGVAILDPFAQGASLSLEDLQRRLNAVAGTEAPVDAALLQESIRAATVPEIIARMLRNLRAIHLREGALEKALWTADRIVTLMPTSGVEHRERGLIYLELECCRAALDDFRAYARLAPDAARAEGIAATIADLQQRTARLN